MLLEAGLITEEQLGEALKYQAQEKERLGTTLVKHNYITEKQLIDTLRIQLGIEYIDLSKVDITPEISWAAVSEALRTARRDGFFPESQWLPGGPTVTTAGMSWECWT